MAKALAESALAAIEFPAALDLVSQYAVTPLGAARILGLVPRGDVTSIALELGRVADAAALLDDGAGLEPAAFPDVTSVLNRLRLDGATLAGEELAALTLALGAARDVAQRLRRAASRKPSLAHFEAPPVPGDLEPMLVKAVDPDGRVRDEASKDLARIRREIVSVRQTIVAALERILGSIDARHRAADAMPTVRAGRYVIPVRHAGRGKLGGIVHDESGTQATLFIEPAETMELGNRLRGVEAEESREVQRILRELTAALRPHADVLDAALEMLVAVDACYARARFAQSTKAVLPRIVAPGEAPLQLRHAAHPLLFTEGRDPVRFELVLESGERTILVSGPNTGGKTVLLKAVGLSAALAQSGVLPAVGDGSVLPVFTALFADIGDRQSISESLSTFSAHVAALREVVETADEASLILLDELGTGTDPAEGAALAAAVLAALTRRGAVTIATTHLGALKELPARVPGIVNASLQFDAATLSPTYRFTKGTPGRSYGLAIARRLGMPADLLAEAEKDVPDADRRLESALATVEARGQEIERRALDAANLAAQLEAVRAELDRFRADLLAREEELTREQKELARAKKHVARDALLEARVDVERALTEARAGKEKEARRVIETEIAALAEKPGIGDRGSGIEKAVTAEVLEPAVLAPGAKVRIRSLGLDGEVESVQGNDVSVRVNGRRVRVRARDLFRSPIPDPRSPSS